uniref:Sugar phosphate transporter domain-containing protein n=1 Tax=Spongospora subterranea TaxID=70186 RepID=A0A0H5RKN7_9EUKA|eukprot:CRZ09279.1 hypothetical protein [Spongospora subterranea]
MARKTYSHTQDILHLLGCSSAIYLCFLSFAIVQERLYRTSHGPDNERYTFTVFLVFCQCFCNALVAGILKVVFARTNSSNLSSSVPIKDYLMISSAYIGAMLSSNMALRFVNYPTQVLGKSCKMIPVMLMGVFINKKRYRKREYIQVLLISLGISIFMGFQGSSDKRDAVQRIEGVALLLISLFLDGFTGPLQERVISNHRPSVHGMMFGTNVYAIPICLGIMIFQGTFGEALSFVQKYPMVLRDIGEFCIFSALGQNVIFLTMFRFDSLILTTITTTRKFFTIMFSVLWFGNAINAMQWVGVTGVFAGLGLNIYSKYQAKKGRKEA